VDNVPAAPLYPHAFMGTITREDFHHQGSFMLLIWR